MQWMREACRMTSHAATTALNVAKNRTALQGSIAAVEDGSMGLAHLAWMASTANRLQTSPTASQPFDESKLLHHAKNLSVQRFRRKCEHLIHATDHEEFVRSQIEGVWASHLKVATYDDGSVRLDGLLDPEGGAIVTNVLAPFARPSGADDHRNIAQRNANALVEACNHLLDDGNVPQRAGQRPHLHVTTTLETLLDHIGADAAD